MFGILIPPANAGLIGLNFTGTSFDLVSIDAASGATAIIGSNLPSGLIGSALNAAGHEYLCFRP